MDEVLCHLRKGSHCDIEHAAEIILHCCGVSLVGHLEPAQSFECTATLRVHFAEVTLERCPMTRPLAHRLPLVQGGTHDITITTLNLEEVVDL